MRHRCANLRNMVNIPTIAVSDIVDQRINEIITCVEGTEWLDARANYRKVMESDPLEGADFTREQLAAMAHLIKTHRGPDADFGVLGAVALVSQRSMP